MGKTRLFVPVMAVSYNTEGFCIYKSWQLFMQMKNDVYNNHGSPLNKQMIKFTPITGLLLAKNSSPLNRSGCCGGKSLL